MSNAERVSSGSKLNSYRSRGSWTYAKAGAGMFAGTAKGEVAAFSYPLNTCDEVRSVNSTALNCGCRCLSIMNAQDRTWGES